MKGEGQTYTITDQNPRAALVHRDTDMAREIRHADLDIGQRAPLRDAPVDAHGRHTRADLSGVDDDVAYRHEEVLGRGPVALVRVVAVDDGLAAERRVGDEDGRVECVADEEGRYEHLDRLLDAIPARRNVDVGRAGRHGVARAGPCCRTVSVRLCW